LAFAQQKAKDTGQSVDYMVDSIVTGLGRKSLMILDNLGLSAAEVKEKMKETGDMTKAVGAIIREQMSKTGDYVETAADRATQANVELENAMLDLGNAMKETFGYTGWDDMAKGIKTELVGALTFTIETINEAKGAWNSFMQLFGAQDKPAKPKPAGTPSNGMYFETTDADGNLINAGRWMNGQKAVNTFGVTVTGTNKSGTKTPKPKRGGGKTNVIDYAADSIAAQEALVQQLTEKWRKASAELRDGYLQQLNEAKNDLDYMTGKKKSVGVMDMVDGLYQPMSLGTGGLSDATKNAKFDIVTPYQALENELANLIEKQKEFGGVSSEVYQMFQEQIDKTQEKIDGFKGSKKKEQDNGKDTTVTGGLSALGQGMNQMASGIEQLGIEVPEGLKSAVNGITAVVSILSGIATILVAIETITTADALIPLAGGGVARAANGVVAGRTFSGDKIPAMLNAGEVVLNRAQVGNLASQFSDVGLNNLSLQAVVTGTQLRFVLNNESQSRGRGQYVTTNFNR
jgi:hypothetical protein